MSFRICSVKSCYIQKSFFVFNSAVFLLFVNNDQNLNNWGATCCCLDVLFWCVSAFHRTRRWSGEHGGSGSGRSEGDAGQNSSQSPESGQRRTNNTKPRLLQHGVFCRLTLPKSLLIQGIHILHVTAFIVLYAHKIKLH